MRVTRMNNVGKGHVSDTAKIMKPDNRTIRKIVQRGPVTPKTPVTNGLKSTKSMSSDVIRLDAKCIIIIRKVSHQLSKHLKSECQFPYENASQRQRRMNIGLGFHTVNKNQTLMESARRVAWQYRFIVRRRKLRSGSTPMMS